VERETSNDLVASLPSARRLSRRYLFLRNPLEVLKKKAALPGKNFTWLQEVKELAGGS